jgi:flagellar hook-basal body complex protein FliE
MAIDLNSIKPKAVAIPRVQRNTDKRDLGPNHWLNKNWDMGLWKSYQDDVAFAAEFKGKIEKVPATRGEAKKNNEMVEKVTGDAGDAITLIREAATKFNIGVAVRYETSKAGYVRVTWYGKTKKDYSKSKADKNTTVPPVAGPANTQSQPEKAPSIPPAAAVK